MPSPAQQPRHDWCFRSPYYAFKLHCTSLPRLLCIGKGIVANAFHLPNGLGPKCTYTNFPCIILLFRVWVQYADVQHLKYPNHPRANLPNQEIVLSNILRVHKSYFQCIISFVSNFNFGNWFFNFEIFSK